MMALLILMGMLVVGAMGEDCSFEKVNGKDIPIAFRAQTTESDSDCSDCIMQYCTTIQLLAAYHAGFSSDEWFWYVGYEKQAKIGTCDEGVMPDDQHCTFTDDNLIQLKESVGDTEVARTACCPLMENAALSPDKYATADLGSDACWARMAKPCSWKYLERLVKNDEELLPTVRGWFDRFGEVVKPKFNANWLPNGKNIRQGRSYKQFCCGRLSYLTTDEIHLDLGAEIDGAGMASKCSDLGRGVHPCNLEELHEAFRLGHLVVDWTLFMQPGRLFKMAGPQCKGKAQEQCYMDVIETKHRSLLDKTEFRLACCGPL